MYIVYTQDKTDRILYVESRIVNYQFTEDISRAQRYKTEHAAINVVRDLWFSSKTQYKVKHII
jgi:hypothetical protein